MQGAGEICPQKNSTFGHSGGLKDLALKNMSGTICVSCIALAGATLRLHIMPPPGGGRRSAEGDGTKDAMKVAKTNAPLWMEARDNLERILAHQEFGDIINTKPLSITTTGACGTMVTSPQCCVCFVLRMCLCGV